MKISSALLVLLLAAACAGKSLRASTVMCCSKEEISSRKIPEFRIQEYSYTSPSCTHKAALVKLRTGRTTCVDPEQSWFQQYLKKQKKPRSTSQ